MTQIIIAIMLYLHLIVSPGTYRETELQNLYNQHIDEIRTVQNNPETMDLVNREYLPQTDQIIIIDDTQW